MKNLMNSCVISLFLTGCCSAPVITNGCESFSKIFPSRSDVLTLETKKQILAHNLKHKTVCE